MALSIAIKTQTTTAAATNSMVNRSNAGFKLEMILSKHRSFKKSQSTTAAAPKLNYISEFNTMHHNEGQCNPPSRIVVQNLFDVIQNKQSKALVKINSMLALMKVGEEAEEQKVKINSMLALMKVGEEA